jgi:hypothetical protein
MEKRLRIIILELLRHGQKSSDSTTSRRLTEDSNVIRVSSKSSDVLLDPSESLNLI